MEGFSTAVVQLGAYYAPYTWFALTLAVPVLVLCVPGVALAGADGGTRRVTAAAARPAARPRPLWLALAAAMLGAFVVVYSYLIPYHEALVGLDYAAVTARRFVEVPIWPATGRFFPLALQEYNLLALIGRSAAVYHAFSIVELLIVIACCVRFLDDVPGWLRCCAIMFLMALPSFAVSFFGIIYPERDMVAWIGLWMVCLVAFDRTRSGWAFCGAMVSAQCLLYYKETGFILIGGYAGARLAIDAVRNRRTLAGRGYGRFAADHRLEIAHLGLCGVFVAVYAIVVARHVTSTYAVAASAPHAIRDALAAYAGSDWVLDALVVVLVARLVRVAARRQSLDPLWDALAIGALAYALAFVKLGLMRERYQAPADFIATMYLTRLAWVGLLAQPRRVAALTAVVVAWVFQLDVRDVAGRLVNRKQYVQGTVRLTAFLRSYARSHGGRPLQLYFPQVGGFELMELSSYLQLEGFDAGNAATYGPPHGPAFAMKSAHRYAGDRCLASEGFRCLYAPTPDAGDLVVYLAGREMPARVLDSSKSAAAQVFHYRPGEDGVERALSALARERDLADRYPEVRVFEYAPRVANRTGADGLEPSTS